MRRDSEQTRIHRINRLLYAEIKEEYDQYHSEYRGRRHDISEIREHIRIRNCVDWLKKHDLPINSALGIFAHDMKIPKLKPILGRWVGNSDKNIEYFLTGAGLWLFDEIRDYDECEYETQRVILEWKEVDWYGKRRLQCRTIFQNGT